MRGQRRKERRERGKGSFQPAASAAWFGFASEASAISFFAGVQMNCLDFPGKAQTVAPPSQKD